jgi:DNA processing protein
LRTPCPSSTPRAQTRSTSTTSTSHPGRRPSRSRPTTSLPDVETAALVALLRVGQRPAHVYAELVEQAGSARAILDRELESPQGEQTTLLRADPDPLLAEAATDVSAWTAQGIRPLSVLDSAYPENLRGVHDRPPLIFVAGQLLQADTRAVAVIGTRRASDNGLQTATTIARHLAASGFTVVSGLAAGIDTAAHRAALESSGRTVAVIGTGLNRAYPAQNAALQARMATQGAVVSQFWPDSPPRREAFPQRNATMSGLALATVIVEASQTSGVRIQARRALAHGRPVFLTTDVAAEPWAKELARRPGAHVIQAPEQIVAAVDRLDTAATLTG